MHDRAILQGCRALTLLGKNDRLQTIREDKLLEDVPGAARFDVVVSEGKTQQQRFVQT